jgi:transcriptional regulator with XRE-family HTH domain
MLIGERVAERMQAQSLSQAELARRIGISQQAVGKLVNGSSRSSSYLHRIARELRTTPEYLSGEIDDPDENAPPPVPRPMFQHILMPVALPGEAALAEMFAGLLETVDRKAPVDALARELAQLLPTALTQLRGRLIERPVPAPAPRKAAAAAPPSGAGGPRR